VSFSSFADSIVQTTEQAVSTLSSSSSNCQQNGTGLTARYSYNSRIITTQVDPTINFSWGTGSPAPGVNPDDFKVEWTGYLEACESGNYEFILETGGTGNANFIVDNLVQLELYGSDQPVGSKNTYFSAGEKHPISISYLNTAPEASVRFSWKVNGDGQEIVPKINLYPNDSAVNNLNLSIRVKANQCSANNLLPNTDSDCRIDGIQVKIADWGTAITDNNATARNSYNGFIGNLPSETYTIIVNDKANNPNYNSYFETKTVTGYQLSSGHSAIDIYLNKAEATNAEPVSHRDDFSVNVYQGLEENGQETWIELADIYVELSSTTSAYAKKTDMFGSAVFESVDISAEYELKVNDYESEKNYGYSSVSIGEIRLTDYLVSEEDQGIVINYYQLNIFLTPKPTDIIYALGNVVDGEDLSVISNIDMHVTLYKKDGGYQSKSVTSEAIASCPESVYCPDRVYKGNYFVKFEAYKEEIDRIEFGVTRAVSQYSKPIEIKTVYTTSIDAFWREDFLDAYVAVASYWLERVEGDLSIRIDYYNAQTGESIRLNSNEVISNELELEYSDYDNEKAYFGKTFSGDKTLFDIHKFNYNSAFRMYYYLETSNYQYVEEVLLKNSLNRYSVYLIPINSTGAVYCQSISGLDFCTYYYAKDEIFNNREYVARMEQISVILGELSNQTKVSDFYIFVFPDHDRNNCAARQENSVKLFGINKKVIGLNLFFLEYPINNGAMSTLFHEFGHLADFQFDISGNYGGVIAGQFNKMLVALKLNKCYEDYPSCFTHYQTNNRLESWADFFKLYISNPLVDLPCNTQGASDFRNVIEFFANNQDSNNSCMSKECKNILLFYYQYMRENFPNLQSFKPTDTISKEDSNQSSVIALSKTTTKPQIVLAAGNSMQEYNNLMSDLGYHLVSPIKIDTIAKLSDMNLSSEHIAEGIWLRNNYNTMTTREKIAMQTNIYTTMVSNYITQSSSTQAIKMVIEIANNFITNMFTKIGVKTTVWLDASGRVLDQKNNPIRDTQIMIGNKSGYIDKDGYFKVKGLERTKSGVLQIKVYDPNIDEYFSVRVNAKITIPRDQKRDITKLNIKVIRSYNWFQGTVYNTEGRPLNTGTLKAIYEGRVTNLVTCPINSQGKFSCALPHGKYSFALYHKNKRVYPKSTKNMTGHLLSDVTTLNKVTDAEIRLDR
jgi:hypothetical protein